MRRMAAAAWTGGVQAPDEQHGLLHALPPGLVQVHKDQEVRIPVRSAPPCKLTSSNAGCAEGSPLVSDERAPG